MATYLDFVGLNTLIYEPITSSTNTIGYPNLVDTSIGPQRSIRNPATDTSDTNHLTSLVDGTTTFPSSSAPDPEYLGISFWLK